MVIDLLIKVFHKKPSSHHYIISTGLCLDNIRSLQSASSSEIKIHQIRQNVYILEQFLRSYCDYSFFGRQELQPLWSSGLIAHLPQGWMSCVLWDDFVLATVPKAGYFSYHICHLQAALMFSSDLSHWRGILSAELLLVGSLSFFLVIFFPQHSK